MLRLTRLAAASATKHRSTQVAFRSMALRWHHSGYETSQLGGPPGTPSHRLYLAHNKSPLSPWHDIPLKPNTAQQPHEYNMICEIPRFTNAKLEIDTKSPFNPLKQDTKNGRLRFVSDIFPYKGYIWNYGALPQTYEDPEHCDRDTGCVGDSDPVDVVEVGARIARVGEVYRVKVLGLVALIDDGETDWKVFAIRSDDPLADRVRDIDGLEKHMPGLIAATVDWFTKYKVPDGKPLNAWAFNAKPKDAAYAHQVIADTHDAWKRLVHSQQSKFALSNVSVESSSHRLLPADANTKFKALVDGSISQTVSSDPARSDVAPQTAADKWYFVHGDTVTNKD
ncbi:inorganic diphosphatase activity protein [Kickxella alabastrina]|uniref:Inorganic diphosphatase activity protein n=1 Tax=Kickxella alabastrina TaxID=61397 RepID=A0ACC1I5H1_9FUNG|nr:inorganic diphosphatase activity protein [Kickxella alabastrina]